MFFARRSILQTISKASETVFRSSRIHFRPSKNMTAQVINSYDNIGKSELDNREYRGLVLGNNLKVLLISDPDTDKAAAALDVNVGSLSNPDDLPGLAHFCEHMLFLGTKKFPNEDEYTKFISQHGGSSNAYTSSEHTNYYFDISHEHLKGVLDRFSQFFISPLFDESCVSREVNAVHSEHEKNIMSDAWRMQRLDKVTSDPGHVYSKFGTGNKETLETTPKGKGVEVREELLKFHGQFYSSNIMALSVLGRESLDDLTEYVSQLFSDAVNKNLQPIVYEKSPYREEDMKKRYNIPPVKDIRNLSLTFPIPDLHQYYESNPGGYLGHLIGHEGPGSLLSCLRDKGWVNSLVAGQKGGARGFDFFLIQVDLTEDGIGHVDDIIECMFQYIKMLKHKGFQEWVHNEIRDMNAIAFRFKDKEKPSSYVSHISQALHYFPIEKVLTAGSLVTECRQDIVLSILELLHPRNMKVSVIGKVFEGKTTHSEQYYGAQYGTEDITEALLTRWSNVSLNEKLRLPERNEFIPSELRLKPVPETNPKLPKLLKSDRFSKVWFRQDDNFKLPKAVISFDFYTPHAYVDPLHCNMVRLFTDLFTDALNEYSYAAEIAGLSFKLTNTVYGICLSISGYDDKQSLLLEKILTRLTTFEIDPQRFMIMKELYQRGLENFSAEQPYNHSAYYFQNLHTEIAWTKEEMLDALPGLTLKRLSAFIPKFLAHMHLEALLYGNITKEAGHTLIKLVENVLKENSDTRPLLPSQLKRQRDLELPLGSSYVYKRTHKVREISAIQVYFQIGLQNTTENVLLDLMSQVSSEPFFNILRTTEQLGYVVHTSAVRSNGTQGLRFIVQSERSPNYLEARVEAFVQHIQKILDDMEDSVFESHKAALKAIRLEKPKKLKTQSLKYWGEITSQQYMFERDEIEMEYLTSITKDQLKEFYMRFFNVNGPSRAKLTTYIIGKHISECPITINSEEHNSSLQEGFIKCPVVPESSLVEDVLKFKQGLKLFPRVLPYIDFAEATLAD